MYFSNLKAYCLILIQVVKPEEIVMNPTDDYVTSFVKDVNWDKILRAKTIMLSPDNPTINSKVSGDTIKVLKNSLIEGILPQVIEKRAVVEVMNKDANTSG